jgi:hypothetical protein
MACRSRSTCNAFIPDMVSGAVSIAASCLYHDSIAAAGGLLPGLTQQLPAGMPCGFGKRAFQWQPVQGLWHGQVCRPAAVHVPTSIGQQSQAAKDLRRSAGKQS